MFHNKHNLKITSISTNQTSKSHNLQFPSLFYLSFPPSAPFPRRKINKPRNEASIDISIKSRSNGFLIGAGGFTFHRIYIFPFPSSHFFSPLSFKNVQKSNQIDYLCLRRTAATATKLSRPSLAQTFLPFPSSFMVVRGVKCAMLSR
jgi:hypothetical protein